MKNTIKSLTGDTTIKIAGLAALAAIFSVAAGHSHPTRLETIQALKEHVDAVVKEIATTSGPETPDETTVVLRAVQTLTLRLRDRALAEAFLETPGYKNFMRVSSEINRKERK